MSRTVSAPELKAWLGDGGELALLDVREEGVFGKEHLLFAVCLPLSRLELRIRALVPRLGTRIALCDGGPGDGEGLAATAAERLAGFGYSNVAILEGGIEGWRDAGLVLFSGVNVPCKAFGEMVEHQDGTPSISAQELKAMIDGGENMVVLDSRPLAEFSRMNIPSGIDCPGAELVLRVHDAAPDPATTVVVNCAGRTRSIIGAQSLINAGVPNKVVALRNGTMGWELAGFEIERGQVRRAPEVSTDGLERARAAADRVAARFEVKFVDAATLDRWRGEAASTSLYVLDVRHPEEYEAGHLAGSISAPGGQLVQATDRYVATMGARLVLIDDTGVRARMTAHWLNQLGWDHVHVLDDALEGAALETGFPTPDIPGLADISVERISPSDLQVLGDDATVLDFATSIEYRDGHVPGARWAVRSRLAAALAHAGDGGTLVFTCPRGVLARLAANDAQSLTTAPIRVLDGGTGAWRDAGLALSDGLESLTTETDDLQYRAYDHKENIARHMQEYLDWETGLVEQIRQDGTARFRRYPA